MTTDRTQQQSDDDLPLVERAAYVILWILSVSYSLFRLRTDILGAGWPIHESYLGLRWLNYEEGITMFQWTLWSQVIVFRLFPFTLVHLCIAPRLKGRSSELLHIFNITESCLLLYTIAGLPGLVHVMTIVVTFLIVSPFQSKILCWIVTISIIANVYRLEALLGNDDPINSYVTYVISCWMALRGMSFCFDSEGHNDRGNLLQKLGYCCYLPLLVIGPLISYSTFTSFLERPPLQWNRQTVMRFLFYIVRYMTWYLVFEALCRLLPIWTVVYTPEITEHFSSWGLGGLSYMLGQMFMVNYVVLYGLPGSLASLEGCETPAQPKCIARIHKYSDMWRYFDRGLYLFMKQYMYVPFVKKYNHVLGKVTAMTLINIFIFVWHGSQWQIFLWCLCGLTGLLAERLLTKLTETDSWTTFKGVVGASWERRIINILVAFISSPTVISMEYLLTNDTVIPHVTFRRYFSEWRSVGITTLLIIYTGCQTSHEVFHFERLKKDK